MIKKIIISTKLGMRGVTADVYGPVAVQGVITSLTEDSISICKDRFDIVHVASGGKLTSYTTFSFESAQWAAQELAKISGWDCMDQFIGADPHSPPNVRQLVPQEFGKAVAAILKTAADRDEAVWNRNMGGAR